MNELRERTTAAVGDVEPAAELSWQECMDLLARLPTLPALPARAAALEPLLRNPSPGIRERALRLGAAILNDDALIALVRDDDDAVLRNAGFEILKLRGSRSYGAALTLLRDADPDVALQGVLLLDHGRDPRALPALRASLASDDPNIVQAVILAIGRLGRLGSQGRLGGAVAVADLLPFLAGDPWLRLAAVEALGTLRSRRAVGPLAALLTDPAVGPLAAEAVARIGGATAFRALAAHWLRHRGQQGPELLELLAHVLEGLRRAPAEAPEALRPALAGRLADPLAAVRAVAARCLLALGASAWDAAAVAELAAQADAAAVAGGEGEGLAPPTLPRALARRGDLAPLLLAAGGAARTWGILLCARPRQAIPGAAFLGALGAVGAVGELASAHGDVLAAAVRALARLHHPGAAAAALDLYFSLPADRRAALQPLLQRRRAELRAALDSRADRMDMNAVDRVVLAARLGDPSAASVAAILALAPSARVAVILQLSGFRALMAALPWQDWLNDSPDIYGEAAAEAASRARLRQLLPALRRLAAPSVSSVSGSSSPLSAAALRAFGELGDRASVPLVLAVMTASAALRPQAMEALGRIGGSEARAALRAAARGSHPGEARAAFRALTFCAGAEEQALFRAAAGHADWYVRLMAVEALGRFGGPENLDVLARLTADPVPAVAGRALSLLES